MSKLFVGKLIIASALLFFLSTSFVFAQENTSPDIKIKIGGFTGFNAPQTKACENQSDRQCLNIGWIGQYVSALFTYGISLAVILSVVMIMIGGLVWLMSGGRQDQIGRAKEFITGALSGLLLALFSVVLLQAINPGLINFAPLEIQQINNNNNNNSGSNTPGSGSGNNTCQQELKPHSKGCCYIQDPEYNESGCISYTNPANCDVIYFGEGTNVSYYPDLYCDSGTRCVAEQTYYCPDDPGTIYIES